MKMKIISVFDFKYLFFDLKFFNFHKDQKTHIYGKKEIKNGRKMGHITYPI